MISYIISSYISHACDDHIISSFIIHHSSFIIHHPSFTIHHSSFIVRSHFGSRRVDYSDPTSDPLAHEALALVIGCAPAVLSPSAPLHGLCIAFRGRGGLRDGPGPGPAVCVAQRGSKQRTKRPESQRFLQGIVICHIMISYLISIISIIISSYRSYHHHIIISSYIISYHHHIIIYRPYHISYR